MSVVDNGSLLMSKKDHYEMHMNCAKAMNGLLSGRDEERVTNSQLCRGSGVDRKGEICIE